MEVFGTSMLLLLRDLCRSFGTQRGEVRGGNGVGFVRELATILSIWRDSPLRSRYHLQLEFSLDWDIGNQYYLYMECDKSVDILATMMSFPICKTNARAWHGSKSSHHIKF